MSISNYLENQILDLLFDSGAFAAGANVYISLHTADPGETGASEVTGGSYARQAVNTTTGWDAASGGATANAAAISFASMPAVTVTHVGIWDALTVGNNLWGGALTVSKVLNSGDTFEFAIGDLDVTLD